MTTIFHLRQQPAVPLEAEVLSPGVVRSLTNAQIGQLVVYHGKRQVPLSEFFDVEGDGSDDLVLHGDLSRVRWIGRAMSQGSIVVHGPAGMHLGAYMRGGSIEVHGNVSDWAGAEMTNGLIRIHGNAGGQIGAAYRGSLQGMRNGTIVIDGSAGMEVGMRMRRGTIVLGGPAKDFTGLQMKGGTIILRAGAEIRTGAWMNRGTIITLQPLQMMPTFAACSLSTPTFVHVYARFLKTFGVDLPCDPQAGSFRRFAGDLSVPGKGEILQWQAV